MPTPTTAFADVAAKYGDVDPNDIEAVQNWFVQELPALPIDTVERVIRDLLSQDGAAADREIVPIYPERAPVPSFRSSPPIAIPILAENWQRILRRFAARLSKRGRDER